MALKKLFTTFFVVCALALSAQAQFLGTTNQQSVTSVPFNNSTCTAALAAGPSKIQNIGQGSHFLDLVGTANGLQVLQYSIQGSYDGITFFDISDIGTFTLSAAGLTGVSGSGYYPVVAATVSACSPGTANVTLKYSGISMPAGPNYGLNQIGQLVKNLGSTLPTQSSFNTAVFRTPFGSTSGLLAFTPNSSLSGSPTLQVYCSSNTGSLYPVTNVFAIQAGTQTQIFQLPALSCPWVQVQYAPSSTTATFNLDYTFIPPGLPLAAQQYLHVAGTTATAVKAIPGYLHTVSINTGAAGTISFFDLAAGSCSGTPSTNTVAVITAASGTVQTLTFDVNFLNGICVKASVAMDFTVSYQ